MLNVSDEAGNTVEKTWEVLVEDSSAPVAMPSLSSTQMSWPPQIHHVSGIISHSSFRILFDDLDSIDDTMWTISVDGEIMSKIQIGVSLKKTLLPLLR